MEVFVFVDDNVKDVGFFLGGFAVQLVEFRLLPKRISKVLEEGGVVLACHFFAVVSADAVQNGPRSVLLDLAFLSDSYLRHLNPNVFFKRGFFLGMRELQVGGLLFGGRGGDVGGSAVVARAGVLFGVLRDFGARRNLENRDPF